MTAAGTSTVGYVTGPQFQVVTNATVMPTGLPTMTPAGQSINADDASLILDSGLASVYSRWNQGLVLDYLGLIRRVLHISFPLPDASYSSFFFLIHFFLIPLSQHKAFNWNMVRLLMLVSHLTHLTRLMLSSFLFVLYFFSF